MGTLVYGTTILLWPMLVSSHLTRFSSQPLPIFTAEGSKQFETPPVPIRFAPDISRGPAPPDPFEPQPDPVEFGVDSVPDASGGERSLTREAPPLPNEVELPGMDDASLSQALIEASEKALADAAQPSLSPPAPPAVQRRLLIETSLPRASQEERLPTFELPVGSDGATVRLPLIPVMHDAAPSVPASSATYRTE